MIDKNLHIHIHSFSKTTEGLSAYGTAIIASSINISALGSTHSTRTCDIEIRPAILKHGEITGHKTYCAYSAGEHRYHLTAYIGLPPEDLLELHKNWNTNFNSVISISLDTDRYNEEVFSVKENTIHLNHEPTNDSTYFEIPISISNIRYFTTAVNEQLVFETSIGAEIKKCCFLDEDYHLTTEKIIDELSKNSKINPYLATAKGIEEIGSIFSLLRSGIYKKIKFGNNKFKENFWNFTPEEIKSLRDSNFKDFDSIKVRFNSFTPPFIDFNAILTHGETPGNSINEDVFQINIDDIELAGEAISNLSGSHSDRLENLYLKICFYTSAITTIRELEPRDIGFETILPAEKYLNKEGNKSISTRFFDITKSVLKDALLISITFAVAYPLSGMNISTAWIITSFYVLWRWSMGLVDAYFTNKTATYRNRALRLIISVYNELHASKPDPHSIRLILDELILKYGFRPHGSVNQIINNQLKRARA